MLLFDNNANDMEKVKLKIVALEEENLMLLDTLNSEKATKKGSCSVIELKN